MSAANEPSPPIPPEKMEQFQRLGGIFMPYARKRTLALYPQSKGTARFVHYTTADSALKIIKSKRLWMRNAMCMTDYREVDHGYDMLTQVLLGNKASKAEFVSSLDACVPGTALRALDNFILNWRQIRSNTYIASVSEHYPREDLHGRLSMWRAFGTSAARVAIVLSIPWFTGAILALNLIFSPVAYFNEAEMLEELARVSKNIRENGDFLRTIEPSMVFATVATMLLAAVTCLKHEGFAEEVEWRAIYEPALLAASPFMKRSIESVFGVPQVVYQLPVDAKVSPAVAGLEFSQIFDRLIIGPTQYAVPMTNAFVEALADAHVPHPADKVFASRIPIRT